MIRIRKLNPPEELVESQDDWTEEYRQYLQGDPDVPAAAARRYAHPAIKARLKEETSTKCAYCESKFAHVQPGDIEHIAPKSRFPDLIVEWTNLTLACQECNRRKSDYFNPARPLIHPYEDEPSEHLEAFGPLIQARPTSLSGAQTVARIELNRADLLLQRVERLNELCRLRRLAMNSEDPATREFYLEELERKAEDHNEFSMVAKTYVEAVRDEIQISADRV